MEIVPPQPVPFSARPQKEKNIHVHTTAIVFSCVAVIFCFLRAALEAEEVLSGLSPCLVVGTGKKWGAIMHASFVLLSYLLAPDYSRPSPLHRKKGREDDGRGERFENAVFFPTPPPPFKAQITDYTLALLSLLP